MHAYLHTSCEHTIVLMFSILGSTGGNVGYPYKIATGSMECYNPKTDQWSWCGSLPVERYMHSAVAVDGRMYVLGGRDDKDR